MQYDIELVHNIEQYTGVPLSLCPDVKEDDVLKLLNQVAKASRVAKMRLMEQVREATVVLFDVVLLENDLSFSFWDCKKESQSVILYFGRR